MIPRKIQKVGNSFAITIPVSMLRYIEAGPGDYVSLVVKENKKILIQRIGEKKTPSDFIPGIGWVEKKDE